MKSALKGDLSVEVESQYDDIMITASRCVCRTHKMSMRPSNSQDDDSMTMCLSNTRDDDSM
jgi:hypothetical protein